MQKSKTQTNHLKQNPKANCKRQPQNKQAAKPSNLQINNLTPTIKRNNKPKQPYNPNNIKHTKHQMQKVPQQKQNQRKSKTFMQTHKSVLQQLQNKVSNQSPQQI